MNTDLRIKEISLINYRCFKQQRVAFPDWLTVLSGKGKSSFADAVVVMLRNIRHRLRSDASLARSMVYDDITDGKDQVTVTPTFLINDEIKKWSLRSVAKTKQGHKYEVTRKNFQTNCLFYVSTILATNFREVGRLPIMSYWYNNLLLINGYYKVNKLDVNPIKTYDNAMEHGRSKAEFFIFLTMLCRHACGIEAEAAKTDEKCIVYEQICKLITEIIPFFKDFRISTNREKHCIKKTDGSHTTIAMLSDREQRTLHFVGDTLYRIFIANNRSFENPYGIIVIDDFETIFHDTVVLETMHKMFPAIQFIVTTRQPEMFKDYPIIDLSVQRTAEDYFGATTYDNTEEKIW